jgi:hypothetical protein
MHAWLLMMVGRHVNLINWLLTKKLARLAAWAPLSRQVMVGHHINN